MTYDPWAFDEGGFTRDYTGTIKSITFAPGQFNFQATVETALDEPETDNRDGSLRYEKYEYITVGGTDQWVAVDNGRAFKHATKPDAHLRGNSGWGEFCKRMLDLVGADVLRARGTPFEAKTYEGFHLHWVTEGGGVPYSFTDKVTGEVKSGTSKGKPMPIELIGEAEVAPKREFDPATKAVLRECAEGADSQRAFQAAVMNRLPQMGDKDAADEVVRRLADEKFWVECKEVF